MTLLLAAVAVPTLLMAIDIITAPRIQIRR